MAVKIRLKRIGAKKAPFYRVVVADERSPRDGKFIEEIGYYNPLTEPADIKINAEKATKWLNNGAQPTETVRTLLKKSEIINGSRRKRIASGSGTQVEDVNKLLKQFEQMKKMMKQFSGMGKRRGMFGGMKFPM